MLSLRRKEGKWASLDKFCYFTPTLPLSCCPPSILYMLSAHILTHLGWEEMFRHVGKNLYVQVYLFCLFQSTLSLADCFIPFEVMMQNSQHSWHWMEQFHEEPWWVAKLCGRVIKTLWNDENFIHLCPDSIALLCSLSREDKNSYSERREKMKLHIFTPNLHVMILIQQWSNSAISWELWQVFWDRLKPDKLTDATMLTFQDTKLIRN